MRKSNKFTCFGLVTLILAGLPSDDARAQSIFQFLFGKPQSARPLHRSPAPYNMKRGTPYGQASSSRKYAVKCVRLCDGYYFPIHSRARRRDFHRHAKACKQRCNSGARLFYMPAGSATTEDMIDLSGRRYGDLKNAYIYRKRLVGGCTCRPAPWSLAERARHNRYTAIAALDAADKREEEERRRALADVIAGANPEPAQSSSNIMDRRYVTIDDLQAQRKRDSTSETPNNKVRKKRYAKKIRKRKKTKKKIGWSQSAGSKYRWPGDS